MRRIVPVTLLAASMVPLALGCGEPAEAGKQGAERKGPPRRGCRWRRSTAAR